MAEKEGRRLRRGRREVAPRRALLGLSRGFRRHAGRTGKGPETAGPVEGPIGDHRLRHRDETTLQCSAGRCVVRKSVGLEKWKKRTKERSQTRNKKDRDRARKTE